MPSFSQTSPKFLSFVGCPIKVTLLPRGQRWCWWRCNTRPFSSGGLGVERMVGFLWLMGFNWISWDLINYQWWKSWFSWDFMGFIRIYHGIPSGNLLRLAIENGPVEIVDLPIDSMVIFRSYVAVYQRVINNWLVVYLPLWKIWKSVGWLFPIYWK